MELRGHSSKQGESLEPPVGLGTRVALDLADHLDRYKSKTFGIRTLAQKSGLNEKTIKRLLAQENQPTYQTLFKLYSVILKETNFKKLLAKCPAVVARFLEKHSPMDSVSNTSENQDFLDLIRTEPLLGELYVLAGTVTLKRDEVSLRFGLYGLELLERLSHLGLIYEFKKGHFTISEDGPNMDGAELKALGEYFVRKYADPQKTEQKGESLISFYCYGLNEEGRKEWLSIETEAFYKKMDVAKNPDYQGKDPVFSFQVTDRVSWNGGEK